MTKRRSSEILAGRGEIFQENVFGKFFDRRFVTCFSETGGCS